MLLIRKEQIEMMRAAAARDFEGELVEHIKKMAPRHSKVIGDEAIRETVRRGVERAGTYGLTNRGPVRFFVELMVLFGSDFDCDPLLPWASGVLTNESIKSQMERADILHAAMGEYQEVVAGEGNQKMLRALRRLNQVRLEDVLSSGGNFDSAVKNALYDIYPEKCEYLGEAALDGLIGRGKEAARGYVITSAAGITLLIFLMFELGHGITTDPLYPWVSQTLADESVADPNQRAERLQAKVKSYLDQALKTLATAKTDVEN